jgi:hypothetical protein
MSQSVLGRTVASIVASTTSYFGPMGFNNAGASDAVSYEVCPTSGSFSLLRLKADGTLGGTVTATFYKNGSPTTLTIAATTATEVVDSTHLITVAAGDKLSMEIVAGAGVTSRAFGWSLLFIPSIPGESILMGNSQNGAPAANSFVGIGNCSTPTVTETNVRLVMPELNGILKKFYVAVDTDPTAGTLTFTVFNNSVAGNNVINLTVGNLTGNDTAHTDTIAAQGNVASIKVTTASGPTLSPFHWGIVYVSPNAGGYFLILGSTGGNAMSASGTRFNPPSGYRGVSTTESVTQNVTNAFTAKAIYHRLGTAPGGVTAWDLLLRKGAANTALLTTITGAATTGGTVTDVAIAAGDLIDVAQALNAGVPAAGVWKFAIVGFIADPVVANTGNFFRFF